jgi:hypothetical protein
MRASSFQRGARSWRSMLAGAATVVLLVPVPVLAAFQFNGWNPVSVFGDPLFSSIDTSNPAALTFHLTSVPNPTQAFGSTTITSKPIGVDSQISHLQGNWSGLQSLSITSGSVNVTVTVFLGNPTGPTSANMFSMTLNSSSTYNSGPLTPVNNLSSTSAYIQVTFDYSHGVTVNPQVSTSVTLSFYSTFP